MTVKIKKAVKVSSAKKIKAAVGSSLESFLVEEGLFDDATTHAIKTVLAWQIQQAMQVQGLTKTTMAAKMKTSRSQLDRLLDPKNNQISLGIIHRAASAIGKRLSRAC